MKILTQEEADEHYRVVLRGGAEGFVYSSLVAFPLSYYLHRAWPYYRNLPLSLKALGVVILTIPASVIKAEVDGNAWERSRWRDAGALEIDELQKREQQRIANLGGKQRWLHWAAQRKYSIVGASWALSMAIAFGLVMRNPYQTFPQKLVQARMWAQGLTVGVLLATAGLSTSNAPRHMSVDHSWAFMVARKAKDGKRGTRKEAPNSGERP
ncbi:uncharacterized protein EI90DRAFT_2470282 [Cantharellus anzutake]|uniref:uncharacterized protein n=1 Tax=Cantharellus anzutake TaxID=1750568 RepID=UPI0019075F8C|nr:uncharacterized protein EI90DRAFT_2470282 [Cantharellus anzutake]KAF8339201.1 hypothetical protein EI90DRAFT_2470282 [Cantharellus anzutake]